MKSIQVKMNLIFRWTTKLLHIHKVIDDREKKNSSENKDEIRNIKRKIRIIDSENNNDTAKDIESSEWTMWTESEDTSVQKFVSDKKSVKLQILLDIKEPLNFFKLFLLMNSLMK